MQLRAISAYLVFRHAIKTFNKKNNQRLTQVSVYILLCVHHCSKRKIGAKANDISNLLKLNRHTCSMTTINKHLSKFLELGWIEKTGQYPAKYRLTIEGINTLNEIEERIKNARPDR
jgi:Fe2+ or Zn2+ uptake regulation protein